MLCPLKSARMHITTGILLEGNAKTVGVKRATFSNVTVDRPKTCYEENSYAWVRHVACALHSLCGQEGEGSTALPPG